MSTIEYKTEQFLFIFLFSLTFKFNNYPLEKLQYQENKGFLQIIYEKVHTSYHFLKSSK